MDFGTFLIYVAILGSLVIAIYNLFMVIVCLFNAILTSGKIRSRSLTDSFLYLLKMGFWFFLVDLFMSLQV